MCLTLLVDQARGANGAVPPVCVDRDARAFIEAVKASCNNGDCDAAKLAKLLPRPSWQFLRDPALHTVTLFFPLSETLPEAAFDWHVRRAVEVGAVRRSAATTSPLIVVIGRASTVGEGNDNAQLSRRRVSAALRSITETLGTESFSYLAVPLGSTSLQLSERDARDIGVRPIEYRNDPLVLNQSVQMFIYPCHD